MAQKLNRRRCSVRWAAFRCLAKNYRERDLKRDQRVRVAKKAIHLQIVRPHKVDEAGELWDSWTALKVLDDLLKMNQADLPRRA